MNKIKIDIPEQYKDYINSGGRTEGGLSIDPGWFQLWAIDEIDGLNFEYHVSEYAPGYLGFGSSGGGEMLAFDYEGRISMIPFIGMSPDEAIVIADSWKDFENTIEK